MPLQVGGHRMRRADRVIWHPATGRPAGAAAARAHADVWMAMAEQTSSIVRRLLDSVHSPAANARRFGCSRLRRWSVSTSQGEGSCSGRQAEQVCFR